MRFLLFLFCFLFIFLFHSQAQETTLPDSVGANKIYLVWNNNSALRDSLQKKKVISHFDVSRYTDRYVDNGLVKRLQTIEKLARFRKGDQDRFMFLFNDPNFEPSRTRTVAAISFQGDESLDDLVNEIRYITLDTRFNPLINTDFMPSYSGGFNAMMKYLNENVNLSDDIDLPDTCNAVLLGVIVGKDGLMKNIKVIEGCNKALDNEAYRLVKSMPKWQSGKRAGASVPVFVVLQLIFKK